MSTYHLGICDDSIEVHQELKDYCLEYLKKQMHDCIFHTFTSGEEVLRYIGEGKEPLQILFLDIEMDGIDGLTLKDMILGSSLIQRIVFVSSHGSAIYDTFSRKTLGFIDKPIKADKIYDILQLMIDEEEEYDEVTLSLTNGLTARLRTQNIVYMKAAGSCTYIYANLTAAPEYEEFIIGRKLGELQQSISGITLIRVHKSYIVNADYISNFQGDISLLNAKTKIPIGRSYQKEARRNYLNYCKMKGFRRI